MGLFSKLKEGLTKTRNNIVSGIDSVFSGFSKIDDDFYDELEETLIMGDIGVRATEEIIEDLKEKVKENKIKQPEECKHLLIETIKEKFTATPFCCRRLKSSSGRDRSPKTNITGQLNDKNRCAQSGLTPSTRLVAPRQTAQGALL